MIKKISLMIVLLWSVFSFNGLLFAKGSALVNNYTYQGEVDGMVCAFCAYNVSKKIGQVAGIEADSVNVDLKSGKVDFRSTLEVKKSQISKLFADSGFRLVSLNLVANSEFKAVNFSDNPVVTLSFTSADIQALDSLLDAIGSMAASATSRLFIKAPKELEIELLKPILAGRQKVIKVQFSPAQSRAIKLKLFTVKTLSKQNVTQ